MKINKAKLLKAVKYEIETLGFKDLNECENSFYGFFGKKTSNGYFLTIALEKSNLYYHKFTASLYLSKTTRLGSIWGDIPSRSYQRIAGLLSKEERQRLLPNEYHGELMKDGWWHDLDERSISCFTEAISIAEQRIMTPNLLEAIDESLEVKKLARWAELVLAKVSSMNYDYSKHAHLFIPLKQIGRIELVWFAAAEEVLKEEHGILNKNSVGALAVDAFAQNLLNG